MRLEERDVELLMLKASLNLHYCTKMISARDILIMSKVYTKFSANRHGNSNVIAVSLGNHSPSDEVVGGIT